MVKSLVYEIIYAIFASPFIITLYFLMTFKNPLLKFVIRLGKMLYQNKEPRISYPSRPYWVYLISTRLETQQRIINALGEAIDAGRYTGSNEVGEDG